MDAGRRPASHYQYVSLNISAPRTARGVDGPAPVARLTSECLNLGCPRPERDATWRKVAPGVYAPTGDWHRATADNRHLALIDAALRKHGGDLVLAGASAALILGLPVIGRLPERVQCLGEKNQRTRTSLLRRHVRQTPVIVPVGRCPVTSVATTCIDLARWEGLVQGVCAMDHALRHRLCTREELIDALDRLPTRARGLRVARIAVHLADPLSESPGESLSRVRMWQARIPRPVLQHEIQTGVGIARTDYFWPESVVKPHPVSEFDGNAKYHRESYGRATEETILKERGRERALWRLGYPMARWTWGDAWYDNGARMLAELATVGVRPGAVRW